MRLATVGRIESGQDAGSFIWIEEGKNPLLDDDEESGYVLYVSASRTFSPAEATVWFSWVKRRQDCEAGLTSAGRAIAWLADPTPERFR